MIVSMAPEWTISIPFSMTFITAVIMMMVMTVDGGAGSSALTYPRPRLLQVCLTLIRMTKDEKGVAFFKGLLL